MAPFLVDLLALIDHGLPNLVIGALTVSAVIPFFFLPETNKREIPESVEDMNRLSTFTVAASCCRKRKGKVHHRSLEKLEGSTNVSYC